MLSDLNDGRLAGFAHLYLRRLSDGGTRETASNSDRAAFLLESLG